MISTRCRWAAAAALAVLATARGLAADTPGPAKDTKPVPMARPAPAEVQSLAAYPERVALRGGDDSQQLVLTANLPGGRVQDLTGDVQYEVGDRKIVRVTDSGRVIPLANGTTDIVARF